MFTDEPYTPSEGFATAAGDSPLNEGVEHLTFLQPQSSHRGRGYVGEPGLEVPAAGSPGDLSPEEGVGPLSDLHSLISSGLTERNDLLLVCEARSGLPKISGDDDFIAVMGHVWIVAKPVVR